jgi:hypothetical protein
VYFFLLKTTSNQTGRYSFSPLQCLGRRGCNWSISISSLFAETYRLSSILLELPPAPPMAAADGRRRRGDVAPLEALLLRSPLSPGEPEVPPYYAVRLLPRRRRGFCGATLASACHHLLRRWGRRDEVGVRAEEEGRAPRRLRRHGVPRFGLYGRMRCFYCSDSLELAVLIQCAMASFCPCRSSEAAGAQRGLE